MQKRSRERSETEHGPCLRLYHPKCKPTGPDLYRFTQDLKQRLLTHNQDCGPHTARFSPWRIGFYCAFKQEDKALAFERYLKSHSGKSFASKRLL
ncbi:MAG: GIY-YIG nuclease family protein [Limisphaerales bacterium]